MPGSIYGGLSLQVTMTDNGEPGVADMIGFTLYNGQYADFLIELACKQNC